ncbi:uncharacterized protein LOC119068368 [Bradysia coprophila]|uniref:uncharacterized protein LOC119068368 n=1 Tax=Bradysia coprophila TaxID=38358 RepID=UPI00187D7879|nr:uncharacterized protein LOC119068368 [Bradysia coprophila]
MAEILKNVNKKRATDEVKYYALYAYYFLGQSKTQVARTYNKSISSVTNWINYYEANDTLVRPSRVRIPSKFNEEKIQWLLDLYHENPILYLDEAKYEFHVRFNISISTSHICNILHANNMSWKTLERRAVQIRDTDIVKFMAELNCIDWDYSNLVFLDEISIDNQGLMRTKGYGIIGQKLLYRGKFNRKPRMSMLAFLGQNGILETYVTEGTFNRLKFFDNCKDFALSGICQKYPGRNSVWILDGAKIHCHASIIRYLRSLGIVPIFLPAYTPFFNPIEYVFGYVKKHLKRQNAGSRNNMDILVNEEFTRMRQFPCTKIFKKCGYVLSGKFDPDTAYQQNVKDFGFKN